MTWKRRSFLAAGIGAGLAFASGARAVARKGNKRPIAPSKTQVQSRSAPLKSARTALVPFDAAPFPYHGSLPGSSTPFLNVNENGRKGHRTRSGHVYWEDQTYNDNRVLLHIPKGFDIRRPALMLVFFHGHGATLERDVLARQKVPGQISASNANVVLVAPQLAVDAKDSSAGKFWQPGAFGRFIGEAGQQLSHLHGDRKSRRTFASMPIVIVAYSGGYVAAASAIERGGLKKRVRGVVLLDSLYGDLDKFAKWIEADPSAFFVSVYLGSTRNQNAQLEGILAAHDVTVSGEIDNRLASGGVAVVPGGGGRHRDLLTRAWVENPIIDLLDRLPEYKR
ncbi:alpha/beta hydrolase [Hyphomicrobium methylovorum]|uniref:alpha/beta hydrolase n=1 Tax=Hyphomicrobium methylovorum TaxID=84 RepID=UPI0015E669E7|nr:alpha/beta hydrolase [Hyphomicrobium methylovorum]MBA2127566.1 alpha/beta hydrolase [Hyphomicrobium methylovorum]